MQYKTFLLPLAGLILSASSSYAQRSGTSKIRVSSAAISSESKDSFIVAKPAAKPVAVVHPEQESFTTAAAPAPSNTPAKPALIPAVKPQVQPSEPAVLSSIETPKYGPVPLAGTRSYFGEKNEYVNNYVRNYLEAHNKTLNSVQNSSTKPFSVIDNVLEKKQLPKELKYLAVIESALNHKAVSRAGAVGPWQLMESTAKMMGLSVNRHRDDRTDWYKSTTAATKYLELLYSQLNDWLLVIAAYNSGPTPVQRAIERTGSRNFWDIKEYLPRETQGHVLAFIATASIFENLSKFINLGSVPVDFKFGKEEDLIPMKKGEAGKTIPGLNTPVAGVAKTADKKAQFTEEELKSMTIVRINEPLHLEMTCQELGMDKKLIARWNADYELFLLNTYPTPFYNLRIPKDKLDLFLAKKDQLIHKSQAIFSQNTK